MHFIVQKTSFKKHFSPRQKEGLCFGTTRPGVLIATKARNTKGARGFCEAEENLAWSRLSLGYLRAARGSVVAGSSGQAGRGEGGLSVWPAGEEGPGHPGGQTVRRASAEGRFWGMSEFRGKQRGDSQKQLVPGGLRERIKPRREEFIEVLVNNVAVAGRPSIVILTTTIIAVISFLHSLYLPPRLFSLLIGYLFNYPSPPQFHCPPPLSTWH